MAGGLRFVQLGSNLPGGAVVHARTPGRNGQGIARVRLCGVDDGCHGGAGRYFECGSRVGAAREGGFGYSGRCRTGGQVARAGRPDRCVRRRCHCWLGLGLGADGGPAGRPHARRRTGRRCAAEDFGVTTTILASFPSPSQGVWHLGPVPIRAYAMFILLGVIAALFIGNKRWADRGGERGVIFDIALWAIIFGLIGGRLYHVLTDWSTYFGPGGAGLLAAFKIQEGGLGIWGAVALGGVGAWIGCRRKGIPLPAFGDAIAPGIVLAQAIGRIGNYFNQELYGRTTSLPWGLEIYERRDS